MLYILLNWYKGTKEFKSGYLMYSVILNSNNKYISALFSPDHHRHNYNLFCFELTFASFSASFWFFRIVESVLAKIWSICTDFFLSISFKTLVLSKKLMLFSSWTLYASLKNRCWDICSQDKTIHWIIVQRKRKFYSKASHDIHLNLLSSVMGEGNFDLHSN